MGWGGGEEKRCRFRRWIPTRAAPRSLWPGESISSSARSQTCPHSPRIGLEIKEPGAMSRLLPAPHPSLRAAAVCTARTYANPEPDSQTPSDNNLERGHLLSGTPPPLPPPPPPLPVNPRYFAAGASRREALSLQDTSPPFPPTPKIST